MPQWSNMARLEELSPMIAATVQKAVSDVFSQQGKDWNEAEGRSYPAPRSISTLASLKEGVSLDASSSTYRDSLSTYTKQTIIDDINVSLSGTRPEIQYLGTRNIIKTQTTWQRSFWFGMLHIHGTRRTVEKEVTKSGDLIKSEEVSHTDIKFIPASWIFRKGGIATMTWTTKNFQKPVLSMGLHIFNVVAKDSQIIDACKTSDLATIRRLFKDRIASPLDRNAEGYILTDWAITP